MKNTFAKIASVAVIALALVQNSQAAQIVGNIGFTGQATLNTASIGTASSVVGWINPAVNGTTGSFTGLANNTPVNFPNTWNFTTVSPINPFWTVGNFSFQLLSSSVTFQSASGLIVDGIGIVTDLSNNLQQNYLSWNFSSQKDAVGVNTFTFSASSASAVPDGGATVALLGLALSGVGLLRKKLTA